ncbi:hypothetical protein COL24_29220 [Bacillus toyonensis]|uniref:hypothetical protein n=1 Tax=Bacillus toyonensis TaxID=155322 RepID=UPI000BF0E606|nr:hypothetical protein [Bacillus toyonensis]PEL01465.1 hypothetical protein CN606_16985 [Bacillus toyonensis]PEO25678.1 hypothetical protein CN589_23350 [Bacillus toyonensis]PFX35815.1 hypothetical protein COL24_29220 [Bacillus toyonensis]PFY00161.1 hypothetical protein COL45_23385 [Bacillus toyonensis]PGC14791.1 hypothetical protein COL99_03750 [Bacillus toyonensis]
MEFLFELVREFVKEFVKATVREVSAHFLRKQLLDKDNKKPTPRRRKQKGGFRKKK